MRLSAIALALIVCASIQISSANAQQNDQLGPPPLGDVVSPPAPVSEPAVEAAPNPFRDFNAPNDSFGPGFAEASDQGQLSPIPQNNPPANTPSMRPPPSPFSSASSANSASSSRNSNNSFSPRLARAAPIMGDSLSPSLQFVDPFDDTVADIPTGGGATRRKIGENTGAMPADRFIFNYNNFQNAVSSVNESTNIDRFTLGAEKTFMDGLFSIDVRLPLSANNDFADASTGFSRNGSELGNVSTALKVLLTSDDNYAVAVGLVVDTPTGGGTKIVLPNADTLKLKNEAAHLAPFLGFLFLQDGGLAHQAFVQVDVPTSANGVNYAEDPTLANPEVINTNFEEQTLLYLDYSLSMALYNSRDTVRQVSGLVEFHYTTTLEDSDEFVIETPNSGVPFVFNSQGNRIDVLNLTLGVDTLLSCGANLRFGTVLPINDGDDRFFDVEFLAQLNFPL